MKLDLLTILLTLIIVIYPKLEDWRDKRYNSIWKGIQSKGRILVTLVICLLGLQIYQTIRNNLQKEDLRKLSDTLKLTTENERPVFQIIKKELKWIRNEKDKPVVQLCLENRGCRIGSVKELLVNFYYLYGDKIHYEINGADHTGIYSELVNERIKSENCCLQVDYGSKEYPELILEIKLKYIDPITKNVYKKQEYMHWSKTFKNDEFVLGLSLTQKEALRIYKEVE